MSVVQCRSCGLVYADPMPIPSALGQHYDIDPEAYWHDTASRDDGYMSEQIATYRRLHRGDRVLDIGAGLGDAMVALERDGFDVAGIEPSAAFRDAAIARGANPERLQLAAIEDADLPSGAFDWVAFGAVLEHLADPAGAIQRSLEWVADDGVVWIEVPSSNWLTNRLVRMAYRLQGLDYVSNISPMHPPFHLFEFTLESFRRHGERAGYVVAHEATHVADTYLPKPLSRPAAAWMARSGTGMQLEVWLRRG